MTVYEYHILTCDSCGSEFERQPAYYLPRLLAERVGWHETYAKGRRPIAPLNISDICPACWEKRKTRVAEMSVQTRLLPMPEVES